MSILDGRGDGDCLLIENSSLKPLKLENNLKELTPDRQCQLAYGPKSWAKDDDLKRVSIL